MLDLRPHLGALLLSLSACGGGAGSAADHSAVESAQASWCGALAKASGAAPASWDHMAACKAVYPTASAPYLRGMAKCFLARKEAMGDKADAGLLVADCNDEVTFKLNIEDSAFAEAIDARCERASRCENAPIPDCVAAVKKLEGSQRALLYGVYNAAALHTLSECLKSSACRPDEDGARAACYKPLEDKLRWLP
jgi:hypothetical protein